MTSHIRTLTASIKEHARRLGFDHCRIAPAETALHADLFEYWLAAGRAGEMAYLERNTDKRRSPLLLTEKDSASLRSIIVLAVNYHQFDLPVTVRDDPSRGIIASYAWSDDYHEVIRPLLTDLDAFIRSHSGRTTHAKCLVDTGPVLERDWAQRVGVGFTGKNCCTIHPRDGSWLFLATVIVPEILEYDRLSTVKTHPSARTVLDGLPPRGDYGAWNIRLESTTAESKPTNSSIGTCGRCSRCLDSCPTGAFVGPYHLDPQQCISYWTIESRQPVPRALRPKFGNRIFGCDICQEVCPWNRNLPQPTAVQEGLRACQDRIAIPLLEGFQTQSPYWLESDLFRKRFRKSPVLRAKRHGMLRNVCIALGNWGNRAATPALMQALRDSEPLARGHAAWALGQIAANHHATQAVDALASAAAAEQTAWVRAEIAAALADALP